MAAPTEVVGADLLIAIDSTLIACQTDASLEWPTEIREILHKNNAGWSGSLPGRADWSVSADSILVDTNSDAYIANSNAKLELTLDTGSGTPTLVEVPRLSSIDFSLSQSLATTGALDKALWTYRQPAERSWTVDVSGTYVDPASTDGAVYDALMLAKRNREIVPATLTLDGNAFSGDVAVGDLSISGATGGEDAEISVSFSGDGALTLPNGFPAGVQMIFSAYNTQSSVSAAMEVHDSGAPQTGATSFTGTGYMDSIDVSLADGEEVTMSISVQADGELTRATQ